MRAMAEGVDHMVSTEPASPVETAMDADRAPQNAGELNMQEEEAALERLTQEEAPTKPSLSQIEQQAATSNPNLAPPPVPRSQRAMKAKLLPPPPGVKSRHNTQPPIAHPQDFLQGASQSHIEQAVFEQPKPEPALAEQTPRAELDPTAQALSDAAQPELHEDASAPHANPAQAALSPALAQEPAPRAPRPSFQSDLGAEPEKKSSGTKILFALVGIALLAGLTWWQLGSSPAEKSADPAPRVEAQTP